MGAVQVHRVVEGPEDGPVVVFGGSLGSDLRMWEPQVVPLLEHGFRVVRYDTRGHGASPVPPGPYEIDDLGADFLALLDDLDVAKAHLVGLSLGGMTGMWLGVHAPDRIASLVLCCTSAKFGPPEMWADRARTVRAEGTAAVAGPGVGRWLTPAYARTAPGPGRVPALDDRRGPGRGLRGLLRRDRADGPARRAAEDHRPDPGHRGRRRPGHAAGGARRLIAAGIPGARLEIVADAAHLGNYEQPEEFTRLILGHLEAL